MDAFNGTADNGARDAEAVCASEVNIDLERAGSPVQHRRNRPRGPPLEEDGAAGAPPLLPPAALVATAGAATESSGAASAAGDESMAFSLQASSDDEDDGKPSRAVASAASASASVEEAGGVADTSLPASLAAVTMMSSEYPAGHSGIPTNCGGDCVGDGVNAVRESTRAPVGSVHSSILNVPELAGAGLLAGGGRAQDGTPSCDGASSPAPVTVLGVAQDLRRKRVKKVSHYILGPLLGEGSYGVVRDAINVSADQKRFSRCAIKMLATTGSGSTMAAAESRQDLVTGEGRRGRRGRRAVAAATPPPTPADVTADGGAQDDRTEAAGDRGTAPDTVGDEGNPACASNEDAATGGDDGPRLTPWNGKGLVRSRDARSAQEAKTAQNEINNLQRFHSKNVIRAIDVFARYGKEYVVMPIAICSLQQFVRASIHLMREQELFERAHASPDTLSSNGSGQLLRPRALEDASSAAAEHGLVEPSVSSYSAGPSSPMSAGGVGNGSTASLSLEPAARSPPSAVGIPSSLTVVCSTPPAALSLAQRLVQEEWNPAQHYLRDGALFSPTLTKGLFYQLLAGVDYLHQQLIAHNDIKPSNLLLFEDGSVKLTDLGSVGSTYAGQGTPLYASPELCKYYYGMRDEGSDEKKVEPTGKEEEGAGTTAEGADRQPSHNEDPAAATVVDALANDMWCCGLVLYYLITGRPGPLPVHTVYHRYHEAHLQMEEDGALHPTCHLTRWSLYRAIAAQTAPVDLDGVPDLIVESTHTSHSQDNATTAGAETTRSKPDTPTVSSGGRYPPNGARDLLAQLLEIDPAKRIRAEAALQHPWVRMTFKPSRKKKEEKMAAQQESSAEAAGTGGAAVPTAAEHATDAPTLKKPPSKRAMEDAIQRDVARRVLQSRHVKAMTTLDRQRHLQFAADCCHILGVPLPREILRNRGTEPYEDEADLDVPVLPATATSGTGRAAAYGAPEVMPEGCVDTSLFLPPEEYDYYEQKCGRNEFDVVVLRNQPLKVRQMEEYLHNVVLVQCGYRTREDPQFAVNGRGGGLGGLAPKTAMPKPASPSPVTISSGSLVIRPGGGSLSSGVGTSVFSTNSHTINQLQRSRADLLPASSPTTVGGAASTPAPAARGVVASDESSQESIPGTPVSGSARTADLPAVTVSRSGCQASNDSVSGSTRTPAERARRAARLSQEEAVLAAQEGQTAIKESSKCFCGLM